MTEFDRLRVWSDPATRRRLGWYREVAANRRPAKFRIAATIPLEVALDAAETDLWVQLERLTPVFLERWHRIRHEGGRLRPRPQRPSLLELCRELAFRMLAHCNFCRWNCRVDRSRETKFGACKLGAGTRISTWFHHQGEELVYRGTQGSGTIFFTSCNMRCAFCQNGDISTDKDNGELVDGRALARMAGCCAWKAVTTSTGWAGKSRSTCTGSSRPLRCLVRASRPPGGSCAGAAHQERPLLLLRARPRPRHLRWRVQRPDALEFQLLHDPGGDEEPSAADRRVAARLQVGPGGMPRRSPARPGTGRR